jgi:hypothetical protein
LAVSISRVRLSGCGFPMPIGLASSSSWQRVGCLDGRVFIGGLWWAWVDLNTDRALIRWDEKAL